MRCRKAGERGAWMTALAEQLTSVGLDPHPIGLELATSSHLRVREDGRSGPGQVDETFDIIDSPPLPLGGEQEATGRESHAQGPKLAKAIHATMGLDRQIEKIAHVDLPLHIAGQCSYVVSSMR